MADQPVTIEKLINADKDIDSLGEAANEVKVVTPRYGNPYKSGPLAIKEIEDNGVAAVAALNAKADQVVAQGFYKGYTTEALLLADKPAVAEMRARADDTRKIYRWNRTSAEGVTPVAGTWTDTGLSDKDLAAADASAKVSELELKTLKALYSRYGIAKSLDNSGSSTSSSTTSQAVILWESIKHNNDIATNINGLFVAVKLDVSGAIYPSTNNDSAVFIDALQVQVFEGSTKKGTYAFTRLGTTDVWYYQNTDLVLSNITQIKIFAKPVAGVTITLSQASINVDGGFGNPEIAARNQAIQENTTYVFESYLLSLLQENKNLLGINTSGTSTSVITLINPLTAQIKKYSAVCIIDTDGTYTSSNGSSSGFQARIETTNAAGVAANHVFLKRIGTSKVWYVKDAPVLTTDAVSVKMRATKPSDGTYITIKNAVITENSLPNPLYQLIDPSSPSVDTVSHPTTAFEAIAQAATRRVDIVAFGDSNQYMDGYGFDFALRDALTARFGLYATPPMTGGNYGTQTGATDTQKSKALAGIPYNYVESGTVTGSGSNGLFAGQSSENQLYKLNPSAKLRCHFAYSTFATGSGSFNAGARLEASPYTLLGSSGAINTNTGAETYQLSSFDVAAGDRSGKQLGFRFANVNQTLTGPFLSYFIRVEDVDKSNGICFSTIYGRGGQSLWDMNSTMDSEYTKAGLTNYFSEIRRLQLSKNQSPLVVIYINSGLNDQNETSSPSWGWRESTDGKSATAYLDNLEALVKRISDVWQMNGWNETELFFWINPSHPTSTPDAAKLKAYRKAAFTFAGSRARVSFVDFENLTSESELTANDWYRQPTDHYHLKLAGYEALSQRIVDLIK